MLTKIIGATLVIISTSAVGLNVAASIEKRINELKELRKILMLLRGEIDFDVLGAQSAFKEIADKVKDPYKKFLLDISGEIQEAKEDSFCKIWEKNLNTLTEKIKDEEDINRLKSFGHDFGYRHKEVQISAIDLYINELDLKIDELRENMDAKMKVYRTIGIMTGLFLVLILV